MIEVSDLMMKDWQKLLPTYLQDVEREFCNWAVWFAIRQELNEQVYREGGELPELLVATFEAVDRRKQVFLSQGIENALERRAKAKGNGSF